MTHMLFGTLLLLFLALTVVPPAASAAEGYDNCTGFISSLPAVITTPGTWCLNQDLNTAIATGNAIDIKANNVTIDCNDFKLDDLAAGATTRANGINAFERVNATVRRCNVRGFLVGIYFDGSSGLASGHRIEDNRFDRNTYLGILASGDGSTIRRNLVLNTGGSSSGDAIGIVTFSSVDVIDNTISGVTATNGSNGNAEGIVAQFNSNGSSIIGNRIRGLVASGSGTVTGFGSNLIRHVVLRDNDLFATASAGSVGLACTATDSHAQNNAMNGFVTGVSGCGDDGGNVVAP